MPLRALREGITSKNMITKQELIDLATFVVRKNPCIHLNNLIEVFFEYQKSIKSSDDELEICRCKNQNCMSHKGDFCMARFWDCKERQID